MGTRLQMVMGMLVGLLLAGCAEEVGLDQHGRKVPAERLEGQWLVINYWAEWCGPCRKEIPQLNALVGRLAGQSVTVLGVNFDGLQGQALEKSAELLEIDFTVLAQDPASRYQLPRSEVLPVTYIVDPAGQLREQLRGEQTAAGLLARLAALQGEK